MKEFLEPPQLNPEDYSNYQIGKYIKTDLEAVQAKSIVLITVDSYSGKNKGINTSFKNFRNSFYGLMANNWKLSFVDLGIIREGHTQEDTFFALGQLVKYCLDQQAFPIVIGGSQTLVYPLFETLGTLENPINYTSLDYKIPLEPEPKAELQEDNLLNHLLANNNELLFHFTNIGYQSYYTSYQVVDTIHSLDFEAVRLGEITSDLKESEPIFRSSDLVSVNLNALESFNTIDKLKPLPNGFNSREICALSKFAGLSSQLKVFGVFNYIENSSNELLSELLAQILWYYAEGRNSGLYIDNTQTKYLKYSVMHDDKEIVFYKDDAINKWWIAIENGDDIAQTLIPCTEKDYDKARKNEIPDRYWKNLKRFL